MGVGQKSGVAVSLLANADSGAGRRQEKKETMSRDRHGTCQVAQTARRGRARACAAKDGGTLTVPTACEGNAVPKPVHIGSASVVCEGRNIEHRDEPCRVRPLSLRSC